MATGSQATKRARRDAAGYVTGRPQMDPRCSSCMLAEKPPGTQRQTAHDLVCTLHSTGVKTHGVCRGWLPKTIAVKARPAQLQFNQAGGWRGALSFNAGDVPDEFLQAADTMARLSGSKVGMRIVICIPNGSGGTMATNNVLMHWTREEGWVKA